MMNWVKCTLLCLSLFFQDSIQTILLSLTSRIAETHLIHEKRRILSMYRLFVLLLLKDLPEGLGNTWVFFIRDVIYSLLRIIGDETQVKKHSRQQQVHLVVDDDLFVPCCNLIYYVCEAAVGCCSQVMVKECLSSGSTLILSILLFSCLNSKQAFCSIHEPFSFKDILIMSQGYQYLKDKVMGEVPTILQSILWNWEILVLLLITNLSLVVLGWKYFWRLHLGLILYNVFDVGYLGGFQKVSWGIFFSVY